MAEKKIASLTKEIKEQVTTLVENAICKSHLEESFNKKYYSAWVCQLISNDQNQLGTVANEKITNWVK